ncbi:MAG: hypothetical protein CMJ88_08705 [Planctomycetes bacterium]|nr:hypothetical protein [Planctomycetota bacterium]
MSRGPTMKRKILVLDDSYRGKRRHITAQLRGMNVEATKADAFHLLGHRGDDGTTFSFMHRYSPVEEWERHLGRGDVAAVMVVPNWRRGVSQRHELRALFARASERQDRRPIVLVDAVDQSSSPFLDCLPHVDMMLKSQVFRDRSQYLRECPGGYPFAAWCSENLELDLGEWEFGSTASSDHLDRIRVGWNMGVSRFYSGLQRLTRACSKPWRDRKYDLSRRFPVPDPSTAPVWDYYRAYRRFCGLTVAEQGRSLSMTGTARLRRLAYLRELTESRITFSPYGWGEICFRDFEAVACGSVLLKPDMTHLDTKPDIYEPGVTYVPVRWDLQDFAAKAEWILNNPASAEAIAREASRRIERRAVQAVVSGVISDTVGEIAAPAAPLIHGP